MALIPTFDAKAPRKGSLDVNNDTGAAELLSSVAQASSQLADRFGRMADKATIREYSEKGAADEMAVEMPGTDFAYSGTSAATTAGNASPGSGRVSSNAGELKAYLMKTHGMADFRAAAIIGGFQQESGLRASGAVGDLGTAFGLGQWRKERFSNLKRFAAAKGKSWTDPYVQLDFTVHELGSSEGAAGRRLAAATTLDQAAEAMIGFERPRGWTEDNPRGGHGWANRLAYAQTVLGAAAAAGPAVDPTVTGATSDAVSVSPQSGAVRVTLTGKVGRMAQMRPGTLAGDAYNAAAAEIHVNRLDTAMRSQMGALALQHEADPAGLTQALDALRAGYVSELPPVQAALIDESFNRQKLALTSQAVGAFNQQLESANLAAFEENINARIGDAYRMAAKGGAGPDVDAALAGELGALTTSIDNSPLTPLQKSRLKAEASESVLSARVLGGFDRQPDAAGRAAYAKQFQEDWLAGEGPSAKMPLAAYDRINGELTRRLNADEVDSHKRAVVIDKSLDAQLKFLKKGYPVPQAMRDRLKSDVAAMNDPALSANLDFVDGLADWQKAHVAARPEVIDAQIAVLKSRMQAEGVTEASIATLDVMEGLRDEMKKGLAEDPLTWADRAGVARVEPLDFSNSETLAASLAERVADASAVSGHYQVQPKFFTGPERDALAKQVRTTPLAIPSLVSALEAGLGSDAPRAFAEISDDAPVLAQLGGLVHFTGSQKVVLEVAEALNLRAQPNYKSALPSSAQLDGAAAEFLSGALGAEPGAMREISDTAAALLETRALKRGLSLDDFEQEASPARAAYREAIDQVLGAHMIDGVKHGGLTEVNGSVTIAPPDLPADALQDMLDNLSGDDMLFQRSIGSANGVPVDLWQLRQGTLVRVANGRYRIATGDLAAGDPLYVPGAAGGYFELDFGMLKKSQAARGVEPDEPVNPWAPTGEPMPNPF